MRREVIALSPKFAAAYRAASGEAWLQVMSLIQQRVLLLAVMGSVAALEGALMALEEVVLGLAVAFASDKDPGPCYCGFGLGLHDSAKGLFAELLAAPGLRERLADPADTAHAFTAFQSCELLAPVIQSPIEHMTQYALMAECLPSHLVSILFCVQQRLLLNDLAGALRFSVAALVGASLVPRCLTGAMTGSRSTWPFTLGEVVAQVRSVWRVVMTRGDPLDALWASRPPQEREQPALDSPCLSELAPACLVGGELEASVDEVRYCDEDGVHTLRPRPISLLAVETLSRKRIGWLLPVMSFYNPWHSLLWAISAHHARADSGATDVILFWPTGMGAQELAKGWPRPFWRLAELLAPEARLASDGDECFARLRVGRGHLLDASTYAVRTRRVHFHAFARAVAARFPAAGAPTEEVLLVQRNPALGRFIFGLRAAAHLLRKRGVRVRLQADGPSAGASGGSAAPLLINTAIVAPDPLAQIVRVYSSGLRIFVGAPGGALPFMAFMKGPGAFVEVTPPSWREQCLPGWNRNQYSLWGQWCALAELEHTCLMGAGGGQHAGVLSLNHTFLQENVSVPVREIVGAVMAARERLGTLSP